MHRFSTLSLLPFLLRLVASQGITAGPQVTGRVSIRDPVEYTLQRSCVQHCLYYNGNNPRGYYYNNWDDVGGELGCGHAPINGCYCNTKYASSATSYFSSCIAGYCGTSDPEDFVSAVSFYDAYCATANGNPTKPVPEPVSAKVTTPSASENTSSAQAPSTSAPSSRPTSAPAPSGGDSARAEEKSSPTGSGSIGAPVGASNTNTPAASGDEGSSGGGGLSKGATIGIAVGASVGGVALIAVAVALFLAHQRKAAGGKEPPMGGIEGYHS
ncbi:hypothetical protein DRE_04397 [Drechslerella stenobrocha 248]|uniref:Extracellular membrane protein CFEM domain-containing protein n=1 Tax=Drechslerella stenobrocha 248 TaxID=1043628 RepID=W7HT28_9PEZI|nr:hypothetical protein DRE_04397 [Drechslerella stenobrocha 248]